MLIGATASCSMLGDEPELTAVPLEDGPPSASGPSEDPALTRFYEQRLDWESCRDDMECARLEVPLDYADPHGRSISLAVLRVPATHDQQRLGSLVVNPGGPGSSGLQYAAAAESAFGAELRAAFDVVGFDPRGVGESTPIDCLSDDQLDTMAAADPSPETRAEVRRSRALVRAFGRGCLERSGDLTGHVSSEEAARDMDVLRAALGEQRLTYFGASYGTHLGATYADLFPTAVGRMVLDGAMDPTLSATEMGLVQAGGFQLALEAYVGNCVNSDRCFLGSTVEAGVAKVRSFLEALDQEPIPGADGRELTEGWAVYGVWYPLYNRKLWPALDAGLEQGLAGDGKTLLVLADAYLNRSEDGYLDNRAEANTAVNCLDFDDAVSPAQARRLAPQFEKASSVFGRVFAAGLNACDDWPVGPARTPGPLTAEGADPILVIGTTRDPATPLAWAEALAEQLESGVLVTRDGDGHTGYRKGSDCVDDTVEKYLVQGSVPGGNVSC